MTESPRPEGSAPSAPRRPSAGGGAIIAALTLGGAVGGGLLFGQPVLGMIGGLALGGGIAIAMWLLDGKS